MTTRKHLLSSAEAARRLGVKLSTLYAYVSRGLLRSEVGTDSRSRVYRREDVETLRRRQELRRSPQQATEHALDWGLPVLDSELTLIADGSFYYRGLDAVELARSSTIERVAELLWTGRQPSDESAVEPLFSVAVPRPPGAAVLPRGRSTEHPSEPLLRALRKAAADDLASLHLEPRAAAAAGARILRLLAGASCGRAVSDAVAATLQKRFAPRQSEWRRVLDAALILCADHELNVSSFTARCVASSGATPYDAVTAGLMALRGFRHGGQSVRVEELLHELGVSKAMRRPLRADRVRRLLASKLAAGERIPGYGHPLYPDGDPRFDTLIELVGELAGGSRVAESIVLLNDEVQKLIGKPATIDVGLATVSGSLGLGIGGAWTLFALGRSVGWVAHSIEEYQRRRLIRPRARYVGRSPADTAGA